MSSNSNLSCLTFFKGILSRLKPSLKEEENALPPLPEELIYLILEQFRTEELYTIHPPLPADEKAQSDNSL